MSEPVSKTTAGDGGMNGAAPQEGRANSQDEHNHQSPKKDRYDDNLECQVCFEKKNMENLSGFECDCIFCNECLNQALRLSFTTRALYPPTCGCLERIEISDVRDIMEKDVLDLLEQVPEEWYTENPTYCGQEGCGVFIPAKLFVLDNGNKAQFAACPTCQGMTCSKCNQTLAAHNDLCGKCPRKTVSPELYSFVKENKLTRCPNCRTLVELEEGCNNIRCPCGTYFCFECGAQDLDCKCPDSKTEDYEYRDRKTHAWTMDAEGLDAEVEVRSWPEHEKVICNATLKDDEETGCQHSHAIAVGGRARCHGCLRIVDSLVRCLECHLELCTVCLPQMSDSDLEL